MKLRLKHNYAYIGEKIAEIISLRHFTKARLGNTISISGSATSYLTRRQSIDAAMLAKTSNALQYNFFKHYPVAEGDALSFPEDPKLAEMESKVEALIKEAETTKRDLEYSGWKMFT